MDDLISRQTAIMHFVKAAKKYECGMFDLKEATHELWEVPSAEPEIIRCKECKYMTEHYDTDGNAPYWTCSEWDSGTDYDGFCHYAERRTDE